MASLQKRKQLVNQLRRAHFPFGFSGNKDAQSQYVQKYKQYQIKNSTQANNNARKNNFEMNDGNTQNTYTSEFKQKFPEYHQLNRNQLQKPNIENNIIFGYDGNNFNTNYKNDFTKRQQNVQKPIGQNTPHIQFGDSLTDFTTTYNKTFDPKQISKKEFNAPQMRKTNMILGNDANNFLTQNNVAYQPVHNISYHKHKPQAINNISLGNDKMNFPTQQRSHFPHKQQPKQVVSKQTIRDFKSAHFDFGYPDKNQHLSQAQSQYNQKPIELVKPQACRNSNIDLNFDGNKYYNSSYSNDFIAKQMNQRQPVIKSGQIDMVLVGTDPSNFTTQAKDQFTNKGNPQREKSQKPMNSINLGGQQQTFSTQYKDSHTDKSNQRQNSRLSQEQIKKSKKKNFDTGFHQGGYNVTSGTYGSKLGPSNQLPANVLNGMKNTNIHVGSQNFEGNSIYKSSFPWKKNDQF